MEAVNVRMILFLKSHTSDKQPAATRLQPLTDLPRSYAALRHENKGQLLGDWVIG